MTSHLDDMWKSDRAPDNEVIIVETASGKKDQVEIREGIAYKWRYKSTNDPFCSRYEILRWRGCTGFDF